MEQRTYLKIPIDRVGVLIGNKGTTKKRIEESFGVVLDVESKSGSVEIILKPESRDVSVIFTVRNIVRAIGRGFSPRRAMTLAKEDYDIHVLDLRDYVGESKNSVARVKGRIIGKNGRSRTLLEELTETQISVYGHTVSLIGDIEGLEVSREAILMLSKGLSTKPSGISYSPGEGR
jgi:ribosomal RNA assembly protein